MHKKLILVMLIIAAIAIPVAAVGINLAADDLWYDQNGKLVGNPIPLKTYDEEYYEALKQQQLAEADSIKGNLTAPIRQNSPLSSTSSEEREESNRIESQMDEETRLRREFFNKGVQIGNLYYPGQFPESVDNLLEVRQDLLEKFIMVLRNKPVTEEERYVLLTCLVEKYFVADDTVQAEIQALVKQYEADYRN